MDVVDITMIDEKLLPLLFFLLCGESFFVSIERTIGSEALGDRFIFPAILYLLSTR